ncbi:MAG: chromosomal replication initiator protein DnaA [Burkholderiales bacterium]|nr:chromosomal replication initiator protein DnaA [Burkholderiales bacterium]
MLEAEIVWQQCLALIKEMDVVSEVEFNTWLKTLQPRVQDGYLEIVASNHLTYDFVSKKYWAKILPVLETLTGDAPVKLIASSVKPKINLSQNTTLVKDSPEQDTNNYKKEVVIDKSKSANNKQRQDKQILQHLHESTKLSKEFTFDNFVLGSSNQLAVAIGKHVTEHVGHVDHNPLFIYGNVGLGKTHLMQAIGNEIHKNNPNAKIRYLHANEYVKDVVKASMSGGFDAFKKYYDNLDLLLFDDIQFIAGDKTKSQEEFFYTFNHMLEKGKQVIMTCDTYPKNIGKLNDRLVSRFASGLTVEIQPPVFEMRVAILKRKAMQGSKIDLDDEVAHFIAHNIKSNVRELEGALKKVLYHAKFSRVGLTIGVAKEALMDIIAGDSRNLLIEDIQKAVCDFYKDVKFADLISKKRTQQIVRPRQIAMTLCKDLTQYSLPAIGTAFGGRDHTTVIHAQKTINELRKSDDKVERDYKLLLQMLQN